MIIIFRVQRLHPCTHQPASGEMRVPELRETPHQSEQVAEAAEGEEHRGSAERRGSFPTQQYRWV